MVLKVSLGAPGRLLGFLGSSGVLLGGSRGLLGTESLTKLPFSLILGHLGGLLRSAEVLLGVFWGLLGSHVGLLSSLRLVVDALGRFLDATFRSSARFWAPKL